MIVDAGVEPGMEKAVRLGKGPEGLQLPKGERKEPQEGCPARQGLPDGFRKAEVLATREDEEPD